jgi:lipoprotein-anchoring transpeptidase ErfK/SrfK
MRLPTIIGLLVISLAIPYGAHARVVTGPVQAQQEEARQQPVQDQDSRGRIFERLGIKIIRKGPAVPDEAKAKEVVEGLISEGVGSRDELIERVRAESPVVMTHMVIDLSRQRLFAMNKDDHVLAEFLVSTGRAGYGTPPGNYSVVNKAAYAYSKKYEADMYNWMGLTSNGDIGLHGLKGSGYERRLGRRASHGCIRLSRSDAKYLFSIVPVGMPVTISQGLNEVIYYKPISEEDLMKLIDDLLGLAHPPLVAF